MYFEPDDDEKLRMLLDELQAVINLRDPELPFEDEVQNQKEEVLKLPKAHQTRYAQAVEAIRIELSE